MKCRVAINQFIGFTCNHLHIRNSLHFFGFILFVFYWGNIIKKTLVKIRVWSYSGWIVYRRGLKPSAHYVRVNAASYVATNHDFLLCLHSFQVEVKIIAMDKNGNSRSEQFKDIDLVESMADGSRKLVECIWTECRKFYISLIKH